MLSSELSWLFGSLLGLFLAQISFIISSRGFAFANAILGGVLVFRALFGDSGFRFEACCSNSNSDLIREKGNP